MNIVNPRKHPPVVHRFLLPKTAKHIIAELRSAELYRAQRHYALSSRYAFHCFQALVFPPPSVYIGITMLSLSLGGGNSDDRTGCADPG